MDRADPNSPTPKLRGEVREVAPWLQPNYTQPAKRREWAAQEVHSGNYQPLPDPARG